MKEGFRLSQSPRTKQDDSLVTAAVTTFGFDIGNVKVLINELLVEFR